MREDGGGFRYPHIDESSCIGCRKCIKVCPVFNGEARGCSSTGADHEPAAYGGWNLDDEVRLASSSGGVFSALAMSVLEKGGAVYGASMGEDLRVRHVRVDDAGQLFWLRGSKYRQSDIGTVYQSVRQDLKAGIPVLFSGVPCQIGGLLSFLGGRHELLLTVDIVCHGVPSDHLFEAYVKWQEANYGSRVRKVDFRNKNTGWKNYSLLLEFEEGKRYAAPFTRDPFMGGFLMDICLRPGCYACMFHKTPRQADITLGDFWGVQWLPRSWTGMTGCLWCWSIRRRGVKPCVRQAAVFIWREWIFKRQLPRILPIPILRTCRRIIENGRRAWREGRSGSG